MGLNIPPALLINAKLKQNSRFILPELDAFHPDFLPVFQNKQLFLPL
jgi:hypothetical protein